MLFYEIGDCISVHLRARGSRYGSPSYFQCTVLCSAPRKFWHPGEIFHIVLLSSVPWFLWTHQGGRAARAASATSCSSCSGVCPQVRQRFPGSSLPCSFRGKLWLQKRSLSKRSAQHQTCSFSEKLSESTSRLTWGPINTPALTFASDNFGNSFWMCFKASPSGSRRLANCLMRPNFMCRGGISISVGSTSGSYSRYGSQHHSRFWGPGSSSRSEGLYFGCPRSTDSKGTW